MTQHLHPELLDIPEPEIDHIITEDDTPVDSFPSAKNQRLLVDPLYSSGHIQRTFLADANVGIFITPKQPAIVPDVFVSFDVELAKDWWAKQHRSYFIWEFGKPPDVVVEIVSNNVGHETGKKLYDYARLSVPYYVVFDPQQIVQNKPLQVYELYAGEYLPRPDYRLPRIGLSLTLWEGEFEGKWDVWLRWCDADGNLLLTGKERAEQEHLRAEEQYQRAEQERLRAEQERQRAEQMAARLRELGIDPNAL